MCRIYGRDPAQGPPSRVEHRALHPPEEWAGLMAATARAIREQSDVAYNARVVCPDGSSKHIRLVGHPVVNAAGEAVELIGTAIECTEQHRAERSSSAKEP